MVELHGCMDAVTYLLLLPVDGIKHLNLASRCMYNRSACRHHKEHECTDQLADHGCPKIATHTTIAIPCPSEEGSKLKPASKAQPFASTHCPRDTRRCHSKNRLVALLQFGITPSASDDFARRKCESIRRQAKIGTGAWGALQGMPLLWL